MEVLTLTIDDLTKHANTVKENLLLALEREGVLKVTAKELCEQYVVIVHKPSWFGTIWARLFGPDQPNLLSVTVAKTPNVGVSKKS